MNKYLIVIEKTKTGYSSYSPDVSGCIATGKTIEKTTAIMKEALEAHLRLMIEEGEKVPQPRGVQSYLDALEMSEGNEYVITHVPVSEILPESTH